MRGERALPRLLAPAFLTLWYGLPAQCAAETAENPFSTVVSDCRHHPRAAQSARSIHLNDDKSALCFDGPITKDLDISPVRDLNDGGVFVIRSPGGYVGPAMRIADILKGKAATVVIYDYCISACAEYIYFASVATYVVRNSVVAWHSPSWDGPGPDLALAELLKKQTAATQSPIVKKMLGVLAAEGRHADWLWMWHPRHYANTKKTSITYESYPESQDEVDEIAGKLGLPHIIYDP